MNKKQLPIIIEQDEDGVFVAECVLFDGCYSQGDTYDEAMRNIREVIDMCLEEKENKEILLNYHPISLSFSSIAV
jgi:predicted RNase H-like HicB family nuclease